MEILLIAFELGIGVCLFTSIWFIWEEEIDIATYFVLWAIVLVLIRSDLL